MQELHYRCRTVVDDKSSSGATNDPAEAQADDEPYAAMDPHLTLNVVPVRIPATNATQIHNRFPSSRGGVNGRLQRGGVVAVVPELRTVVVGANPIAQVGFPRDLGLGPARQLQRAVGCVREQFLRGMGQIFVEAAGGDTATGCGAV